MIAQLTGTVAGVGPDWVVLDTGGVGYLVRVPLRVLADLGEIGTRATLRTYMHVRENEIALYGAPTDEEMVLFSQLLSVSGIGPRVALSLLSHFQPGALQRAIIEEDVRSLSGVPGIGTKTAQRIVLELRGKLAPEAAVEGVPGEPAEVDVEVISALTGLGYTLAEARRAAASLSVADRHTPVEDRIRAALQFFARPE